MRPLRFPLAALVLCTVLTSCGKNSAIPLSTLTGNWFIFNVSFEQNPAFIGTGGIGGPITQTGNNLSATLHIDSPCFGNGQTPIQLTGSVNPATNHFTLNSLSANAETLFIEGTFSAARNSFSNGYFSISGSCSGELVSLTGDDKGAIQNPRGVKIPSLSGSWSPVPNEPSTLNLTERLAQSPTPDIDGNFALTGTVTVTGSPCFTTGILQSTSFISGTVGQQVILLNDGSTLTATLNAGTVLSLYPGAVSGGNCNGPVDIFLQRLAP